MSKCISRQLNLIGSLLSMLIDLLYFYEKIDLYEAILYKYSVNPMSPVPENRFIDNF